MSKTRQALDCLASFSFTLALAALIAGELVWGAGLAGAFFGYALARTETT